MANFAAPANAASMGDMFAPPDRAAAAAWQDRKFNVNAGNLDQTRMKVGFNTGNPGGMVDPQALKAMAQGGPYDFDARRNAIAATVQQQSAAPAFQLKYLPNGQLDQNDPGNIAYYYQQMGGGGGGGAVAPAAQQPAYQQPAYQQPAQQPAQSVDYGYTSWGTQGA